MRLVLIPLFATVAALLVIAGARKLAFPAGIVNALGALGLPGAPVLARALGVAELAVGGAGLLAPGVVSGTACACSYAIFVAALHALRRRAPEADCGCFGPGGERARRSAGGALGIALNLLACVVGALGAAFAPPRLDWLLGLPTLQAVTALVAVSVSVYCAYLCFTLLPGAWAAYGATATGEPR